MFMMYPFALYYIIYIKLLMGNGCEVLFTEKTHFYVHFLVTTVIKCMVNSFESFCSKPFPMCKITFILNLL